MDPYRWSFEMVCVAVRYDHGALTVDAVKRKIKQCFPTSRYLIVRIEDVFPTVYAVFECDQTPECRQLTIVFEGEDDMSVLYTCFIMDMRPTWEAGKDWRDVLCRSVTDSLVSHNSE